ncbi:MAG: hypothetical protein GKR95_24275 [Gammaproteobacteria bacterium]|nr:hypothetical protein [Gammaproteobacteria bacterium]
MCNGKNGTPNLTQRFIVGADPDSGGYKRGNKGGKDSITISVENMPKHTHDIEYSGHHGHDLDVGPLDKKTQFGNFYETKVGWDGNSYEGVFSLYEQAKSGQSDPNAKRIDIAGNGDHKHVASNMGNSKSIRHLPPYYALCFIMKKEL